MNAAAARLIHKIETYKHMRRDFQNLINKPQIAAEPCRVTDDNHGVRTAEANEISCDLLLRRMCRQRIAARKVCNLIAFSVLFVISYGCRDRLSRPVSRMLMKSRKNIKNRALADIGITGKSNEKFSVFFLSVFITAGGIFAD